MLYEDIPVTLPAHVLARAVDVMREPVYLWRARVGDSTSITQRRTEPRAIRDRFSAVDGVSRFMAERGEHDLKARYDRSVAEQDLKYFLQQLDEADDEFRALFLDLVNDYFDRARPDVFDDLPALGRLKWHLVRRRLMPELLEVLRFEQAGEIACTPVVRRGRKIYGDYPFRDDAELGDPGRDLPARQGRAAAAAPGSRTSGGTATCCGCPGYAYIAFLELPTERSGRIRLTLEESGHPESVIPLEVRRVRRPDVTEDAPDGVTNYDGSGWEARVAGRAALRHRGHVPHRQLAAARRGPGQGSHPAALALGHRPGSREAAGLARSSTARGSSRPPQAGQLRASRSRTTPAEVAGRPRRRHRPRAVPAPCTAAASTRRLPRCVLRREDGTSSLELPGRHRRVAGAGGSTPFVAPGRRHAALLGVGEVDETLARGPRTAATASSGSLSLLPDDAGARIPLVGRQRRCPSRG